MNFRTPNAPAGQSNGSDSLHLAPSLGAVDFAQTRQIPDGSADRDGLDLSDLTDNLEPHGRHDVAYAMKQRWLQRLELCNLPMETR